MIRKISGAFTGGALGALLDSFNIGWMGVAGVSDWIGIGMKPGGPPVADDRLGEGYQSAHLAILTPPVP